MLMAPSTVVIFGAGATKACGGPLTNEILPRAFKLRGDPNSKVGREGFLRTLEEFLVDNFHLPHDVSARRVPHYPPLPLLLSLVDVAIDRKQSFSANWNTDKVARVRDALEYVIFAVLEHDLERIKQGNENIYRQFLQKLWDRGENIAVISLNYDIIADNALSDMSNTFPDYGCDIATETYRQHMQHPLPPPRKRPRLYKPHGSLNWLYCPACQRLDLGVSDDVMHPGTVKVLMELYQSEKARVGSLDDRYTCIGSPCADPDCATPVRPIMITPSHMKDYRNPHIGRIWYGAARELRQAGRVHIIGYSLPPDDVDVVYLLKQNLSHLSPDRITVVETGEPNQRIGDHEVGRRYRALFGDSVGWSTEGFKSYAQFYSI
jgi:hypothetical protein